MEQGNEQSWKAKARNREQQRRLAKGLQNKAANEAQQKMRNKKDPKDKVQDGVNEDVQKPEDAHGAQ